MGGNGDLRGVVPDPPPVDEQRRIAAIDAALRRFDAHLGEGMASPRRVPAARRSRQQVAVLASAMLVLLVTIPIWLAREGDRARFAPSAETVQQAGPPAAAPRTPPPLGSAAPARASAETSEAEPSQAASEAGAPRAIDPNLAPTAPAAPESSPAIAAPRRQ